MVSGDKSWMMDQALVEERATAVLHKMLVMVDYVELQKASVVVDTLSSH